MRKFSKYIAQFSQKEIRNFSIAITVIAMLGFTWWYGYDITTAKVTSCEATVTKYVTAHYEEDYITMCLDFDGNPYICEETNYWSKPASRRYMAITVNGKQTGQNYQGDVNSVQFDAIYPPMPSFDRGMSGSMHFVGFRDHTDTGFVMRVQDPFTMENDSFRDPIRKNTACIERVGNLIFVNTWYGISYGASI